MNKNINFEKSSSSFLSNISSTSQKSSKKRYYYLNKISDKNIQRKKPSKETSNKK